MELLLCYEAMGRGLCTSVKNLFEFILLPGPAVLLLMNLVYLFSHPGSWHQLNASSLKIVLYKQSLSGIKSIVSQNGTMKQMKLREGEGGGQRIWGRGVLKKYFFIGNLKKLFFSYFFTLMKMFWIFSPTLTHPKLPRLTGRQTWLYWKETFFLGLTNLRSDRPSSYKKILTKFNLYIF